MTRNIWIGIVVVAVLVAGGWWYLNQSSAPAVSEMTQFPTTQATQQNANNGTRAAASPSPTPSTQSTQTSQQNVTLANIKIGDQVGDFKVVAVKTHPYMQNADPKKDLLINFSGETTVRGTFETTNSFDGGASFFVSGSEKTKLPHRLISDAAAQVRICLRNWDFAREVLGGKSGEIAVIIKNYVLDTSEIRVCDQAELVGLAN